MTDAPTYAAVVGARLRATRTERGLSLGALATLAGVGKGSLSEIENGVRNPTLATLQALANSLGVALAVLLAEQPGSEVSSPGIAVGLLATTRQADGGIVETYSIDLTPGARHRSDAHGDGVTEHVYLFQGRARLGPVDDSVEIAAGESATWVAEVEHHYEALDDATARGILVIRTPA